MIQPYQDLIDAIYRAHKEYVDFAQSVGIESNLSVKSFMTLFVDYHLEALEGYDGQAHDQRCQ